MQNTSAQQVLFECWGWLPDRSGEHLTINDTFRTSARAKLYASRLIDPRIYVLLRDDAGGWVTVMEYRDVDADLSGFDDPDLDEREENTRRDAG